MSDDESTVCIRQNDGSDGGGGGGDGGGDGGGGGVITGSWQQRTALRVAATDKAQ